MVGGTGGGGFSPTQTSVWVPCEEMRTLCFLCSLRELQQRWKEHVGSVERASAGATWEPPLTGCLPPAQLLARGEKPHQLLLRDLPKAK